MHTKLIQAHLALYNGDRLGVERWLSEYIAETGEPAYDDPDREQVLWLRAQAAADYDTRLDRLQGMVEAVPPENSPYSTIAADWIAAEDRYETDIAEAEQQSSRVFGLTCGQMALLGGALSALGLVMLILTGVFAPAPTDDVNIAEADALPTIIPSPAPDTSVTLDLDVHTLRYTDGLLQIAAIEPTSGRVVDADSSAPLIPVSGARFVALFLFFECRTAICEEPPQAELDLVLEDDFTVAARRGAVVAGGNRLQPIALGRRTRGWVVFEVPVASTVIALDVTPLDGANRTTALRIPIQRP